MLPVPAPISGCPFRLVLLRARRSRAASAALVMGLTLTMTRALGIRA